MVQRIFNRLERSRVWIPDIGSVSPTMVDRFTGTILQRYPLFASKFAVETMKEGEEANLVLPPLSPIFPRKERRSRIAETRIPANLPGEMPRPEPSEQPTSEPRMVISSPPAVQRKPGVRPVSRMEVITPGAGARPTQPEITLPASPSPVDSSAGAAAPDQGAPLPPTHASVQRLTESLSPTPASDQEPDQPEVAYPKAIPEPDLEQVPILHPGLAVENPPPSRSDLAAESQPPSLPAREVQTSLPPAMQRKPSTLEEKTSLPPLTPQEPEPVERVGAESQAGI